MLLLTFIIFSFFIHSFEKTRDKAEHLLHNKIVEIDKLNQELKILSSYDSLTGIYNRRMILNEIQKEIKRQNRYNHTFCISLLDIDYFKKVNDTYGHLFGGEI